MRRPTLAELERRLRVRDVDGTAWRRALRAAVVVPTVFGLGIAWGSDTVAFYALFGAMAHLVFGDYGGPRGHRVAAYLVTTLLGLVLILGGTAMSDNYVVAALAAAFVGFALTLAGVVGPAVAQLRTPLLLAFVLSAATEAPLPDVWPRLGGWLLAGVVSLVAALVLVPRRDDLADVTAAAADACDQLVSALSSGHSTGGLRHLGDARALAAASTFVDTSRRHALIMLIDELGAFDEFLADSPAAALADAPAHTALQGAVSSTLQATARALRREGPIPELEALDLARAAHRAELERWATDALQRGEPPEAVLVALDGERTLRLLSHVALGVATSTAVASGADVPGHWHDVAPRGSGRRGTSDTVRRSWRAVRAHLSISSVRLHDALRAGLAIGLAVFVAGAGDLAHGFWVVLGAFAVLRTNVLAGERSALEAVAGTAVGFLAAIPILWLLGTANVTAWLLLPPLVFLAAFAGGALPFAVGQAAFTVFVVLAVNIIEPNGWRTGEIRLIDVGVGAAVGVVAGIIFWPRGAAAEVRGALTELYWATSAMLASAFGRALGTVSATRDSATRDDELEALLRGQAAVADLVAERGREGRHVSAAVTLAATAARLRGAAERISLVPQFEGAPPQPFVRDVDATVGRFRDVANAIATHTPLAELPDGAIGHERRQATVASLASHSESAFALVWLGQWLTDLNHAADALRASVNALEARGQGSATVPSM